MLRKYLKGGRKIKGLKDCLSLGMWPGWAMAAGRGEVKGSNVSALSTERE